MSSQSLGKINVQPQQIQHSQQSQRMSSEQSRSAEISPKLQELEVISENTKIISEEAMIKHIEDLNRLLSTNNTNVQLEYDNLNGPQKVSIVDSDSGKLIKQIPAEAAIEIAQKAKDYILGLMIDTKI